MPMVFPKGTIVEEQFGSFKEQLRKRIKQAENQWREAIKSQKRDQRRRAKADEIKAKEDLLQLKSQDLQAIQSEPVEDEQEQDQEEHKEAKLQTREQRDERVRSMEKAIADCQQELATLRESLERDEGAEDDELIE